MTTNTKLTADTITDEHIRALRRAAAEAWRPCSGPHLRFWPPATSIRKSMATSVICGSRASAGGKDLRRIAAMSQQDCKDECHRVILAARAMQEGES